MWQKSWYQYVFLKGAGTSLGKIGITNHCSANRVCRPKEE